MSDFIVPQWPLPANVRSLVTTRYGGVSHAPYESLNLGDHVGDVQEAVAENRKRLVSQVGHPISWLKQTHSTEVVSLADYQDTAVLADGAYSEKPGRVCAVLTADCLPILLADGKGREVAAIHAGWRGLAGGIITRALQKFSAQASDLLVYLGPAISVKHFQVGAEVLAAFEKAEKDRPFFHAARECFYTADTSLDVEKKYYADLYALAKSELQGAGVSKIYGGEYCSFDNPRFYSYRRDGQTGRMATLIWREK